MTKAPTTPKPAAMPTPQGDRIAKVLSRAGIASRREAERLIEAGEVAVNGKVIDSPALNVGPNDRITVRGEAVGQPEPARLWLYYKPEGLVTSASDEKGRETVFDHLPEDMPRVMSIGRLDLNSEGLLLLTNDGELKRRLELPSTGWLRKYRVRVKGNPTDPELEPLRRGITVDGEKFQPMSVVLDRHQGANAWLTIGLREGRNREIRRAINEIGLIVNRLIRISYGPFRLNELEPGAVEEIRPRVLRDQLGLTGEASDDLASAKAAGKPALRRPAKPRSMDQSDPAKRTHTGPTGKFAPRSHAFDAKGGKPAAPRADGPRSDGPRPDTKRPDAAAKPRFATSSAKPDSRSDSRPASPAKPRSFGTAATKAAPRAGTDQPKRESRPRPAATGSRPPAKSGSGPKRPTGGAPSGAKGGPRKPKQR